MWLGHRAQITMLAGLIDPYHSATAEPGHEPRRNRVPERRRVQRHQPLEEIARGILVGHRLPEDLEPDPVHRYQRRERLHLFELGAVPLLFGQHRDVRTRALPDSRVRPQITAPTVPRMSDEYPPTTQIVPPGGRRRTDRSGRLGYPSRHALTPSGAPLSRMNGTGSTAPAKLRSPLRWTSKCRWGPDELPVVPTIPMMSPAATRWPTVTRGWICWWQYLVMTLSAWVISTYQPQPRMAGEPSWPQPYHPPDAVVAWQRTRVTMPPAAARVGVPRDAPRSTPLCVGRCGVRKPETMDATTGAVQPEAAIWPGTAHFASVTEPTERAAPLVRALTIWVARPSCLA